MVQLVGMAVVVIVMVVVVGVVRVGVVGVEIVVVGVVVEVGDASGRGRDRGAHRQLVTLVSHSCPLWRGVAQGRSAAVFLLGGSMARHTSKNKWKAYNQDARARHTSEVAMKIQ